MNPFQLLVFRMEQRGLVHRNVIVEKYSTLENTKERRRRFLDSGLTGEGKVRKNKKRPDFAGLSTGEYHKRYMQMKRNGTI